MSEVPNNKQQHRKNNKHITSGSPREPSISVVFSRPLPHSRCSRRGYGIIRNRRSYLIKRIQYKSFRQYFRMQCINKNGIKKYNQVNFKTLHISPMATYSSISLYCAINNTSSEDSLYRCTHGPARHSLLLGHDVRILYQRGTSFLLLSVGRTL